MTELSRRRVLLGGTVAGAVGVAGLAPPAWTWSPSGSVLGTGAGTDPRQVWDEEADSVVAGIIERGETAQVNAALRTWTKNDQPLPSRLPADLRSFMERARQLPAWADHGKLAASYDFNQKRGLYLGVLYGMASGMMSTVIPREARAVYYSKGGAAMKDRISKTAKLGYDIGTEKAYGPGGEMIVTCVRTRLVHSAVRHLLPQSSHWRDSADEQLPISQADIMVTWHSLATTVMQKLRSWDLRIPSAESEGYLHSWQVTAHMLGVKDEYIPASWSEANSQASQVLTPRLAATPEGVKLADMLMNLAAEVDGAVISRPVIESMTRYMLGDQVATWLEIPRNPGLDQSIRIGWPLFVRFREAGLPLPFAPEGYWMFDEFIRLGTLFFLSEGQPISIEIPDGNNPSYS